MGCLLDARTLIFDYLPPGPEFPLEEDEEYVLRETEEVPALPPTYRFPSKYEVPPLLAPLVRLGVEEADKTRPLPPLEGVLKT